jgi:tetratricopeptide (TPR) repeat protein
LALVFALGCGSGTVESAVITSPNQADELLLEAQEIAQPLSQKFERGDELLAFDFENLKKAKANFESLVAFQPDNIQYLFGLAKVQRLSGETELAYTAFDDLRLRLGANPNSLERQPKLILGECYYELATLLRERGENSRALVYARLANDLTPNQSRYLGLIAIESAQAKDFKAAREFAKRAQKLNPTDRNARAAIMLMPE